MIIKNKKYLFFCDIYIAMDVFLFYRIRDLIILNKIYINTLTNYSHRWSKNSYALFYPVMVRI